MEKSPDSFSDTFDTSGTLVSPCEGVPTVKMFPPPPPSGDEELDADAPTVFVVPRDSSPTVKRSTPPIATSKSAPASRLVFVRGIAMGIALTSLALLAVALIVSAPPSWRDLSEVRPVAMSLVERISGRRAEPEPAQAASVSTATPPTTRAAPAARHHEAFVSATRDTYPSPRRRWMRPRR